MANIKYADPTYTNIDATDDDKLMLRTAAGGDARCSLVQPKGYIDGCGLSYVSGTQIQVKTGAAYIPGPKRICELASAVTLTPSLSASTWYHVYLTLISGVVGAEAVTTAPAAAYIGTARAKTGDTTRRYLGSFRTDASSVIYNFKHVAASGAILYRNQQDQPPFRALATGAAVVETTVSLSAILPVTAVTGQLRLFNTNASAASTYGTSDDSSPGPPAFGIVAVPAGGNAFIPFPVDGSQAITYWNSAAPAGGQGAFVDVYGYTYER